MSRRTYRNFGLLNGCMYSRSSLGHPLLIPIAINIATGFAFTLPLVPMVWKPYITLCTRMSLLGIISLGLVYVNESEPLRRIYAYCAGAVLQPSSACP